MEEISVRQARRLALARAGLLKPEWLTLPGRAAGRGKRARDAALAIIEHFGYLQLDTVSIAGARSHAIVLLSRLEGFNPTLAEELLQPGQPLFEYWGHEASWLPLALYPAFEFRRTDYRCHPWWGDVISENAKVADDLRRRIREEGPLRSLEMEGRGSRGWWDLKLAKRVAAALWSSGELAIRERRNFQRSYDLAERVIPERWRSEPLDEEAALEALLLKALVGHGWARTGTLTATWRLRGRPEKVALVLKRLAETGRIRRCRMMGGDRPAPGWILAEDLELAARLESVRPRRDRGVLLSPFDPVLWDRERVARLFGFEQLLEIFKPAPQRKFGYYCLPILAGERLIGRFDLKASRRQGTLTVLCSRFEQTGTDRPGSPADAAAAASALTRYSDALGLRAVGGLPGLPAGACR